MSVINSSPEEILQRAYREQQFVREYLELCQRYNMSVQSDEGLPYISVNYGNEFESYFEDLLKWERAVELDDEAVIQIGDWVEGVSGNLYEVTEYTVSNRLIGFKVGDRDKTHVHSWQYKRVFRIIP